MFTLTPGSTKYYTDYFTLGHELETPREKLTVSVVNLQGPNGITATIDKIDGRVVKLLFTVNIFEYVATTFDVQFQF
ncbi:MAG: hypothetical protein MJ195_02735 [Mycoplasmoidaceae bacterium]|nr:hypothetical protein [Mycoplasmoidaceae bacterium]